MASLPVEAPLASAPHTRRDADRLVRLIQRYWAREGLFPDVWVESADKHPELSGKLGGDVVWVIRSNMLNGRPRYDHARAA